MSSDVKTKLHCTRNTLLCDYVVENENIEMEIDELGKVDTINKLKQKIQDILKKCGIMEFEKKHLEVKYEALEKEKIKWMIKLKKLMPEIVKSN